MFKSTTDSAQGRSFRAVQNTSRNEHGIDPTTFSALSQERARLVARKMEIERGVRVLKLKIGDAHARKIGVRVGSPTSNATFKKWCSDKDKLLAESLKIETRLIEIRASRASKSREEEFDREKRFERTFMRMAKEMLAHDVYDRIVTAAIHQCAEHDLTGGE